MQREREKSELGDRQRIAIFHGTQLSLERAFALSDAEIDYKLIHDIRCNPEALLLAGLMPQQLHMRGADSAKRLRSLGFDAMHLRDDNFCRQAIACVSANEVVAEFVRCAGDVMSIIGSNAPRLLGLDTETMLQHCVAQPSVAGDVLKHSIDESSVVEVLESISVETLLATCIGSQALKRCGVGMAQLLSSTTIDARHLSLIGFEIKL